MATKDLVSFDEHGLITLNDEELRSVAAAGPLGLINHYCPSESVLDTRCPGLPKANQRCGGGQNTLCMTDLVCI
jgi:hypothetical protein